MCVQDVYHKGEESFANGTNDREACPKRWIAVLVQMNCEKKTATQLGKAGYETYIPIQQEIHQWSDRKKKVNRLIMPMVVFVRATVNEEEWLRSQSYIFKLLALPGTDEDKKKFATPIPDYQIERLKFLLEKAESEVTIVANLTIGNAVRVIFGPLKGLEGVVSEADNKSSIVGVMIDGLGYACVKILKTNIQKNKLLLFRRKDIKMKRLPKYTPAEVRNDPYGFTYKEMSKVIGENEAKALYEELYKQLPRKKNLSMLVKNICKSSDTEKYVYELKDNKYIETVFIKRRDGGTVCVSTQVGCPVGCIFCESGRNGFVRNLTSSEIVQQIILLRRKVNRIVFMGMGEPLFNYDNLIKAIHILRDRYGLNFPTDGITISTVGPVDQLKKLREEHLKIQLTISLHAATQSARNRIIPHMRIYAIEDVVKQALSYSERHNRKIVFAYLLLPGINDRPSDVRQLAKWFRGKKVMINVLQYNPTSNSRIKAPQKREIVAFKHQLEQAGLEVTMRVSHGRKINAACGQLANTYNKFKKK